VTYEIALTRMTALCSTAEHCESDVRERLQRAGLCAEDADRLVGFLYDEGYLDTGRFCRAFAHDKLRFAHWGRVKIAQALRLKGLPATDIDIALDELPETEYAEALHSVLDGKARTLRDEDEYTRRGKLIRFALGRGFAMDEILDAL